MENQKTTTSSGVATGADTSHSKDNQEYNTSRGCLTLGLMTLGTIIVAVVAIMLFRSAGN